MVIINTIPGNVRRNPLHTHLQAQSSATLFRSPFISLLPRHSLSRPLSRSKPQRKIRKPNTLCRITRCPEWSSAARSNGLRLSQERAPPILGTEGQKAPNATRSRFGYALAFRQKGRAALDVCRQCKVMR